MINSIEDLNFYIKEDLKRHSKPPKFIDWILHNEKWYIQKYLIALRHVEYHLNTNKKNIFYLYWWFIYKRLGFKLRYTIYPNTTGPGLAIWHTGDFIWIKSACRIGKHCTIRPGVVIGQKVTGESPQPVTVGDNCDFSVGVRIFGSVKIGDNVTVGANAVVTHDIPSNSIAVGIPAKIIKYKTI